MFRGLPNDVSILDLVYVEPRNVIAQAGSFSDWLAERTARLLLHSLAIERGNGIEKCPAENPAQVNTRRCVKGHRPILVCPFENITNDGGSDGPA